MRRQSQGWQMRLQPRTAEGRRPPGEAGMEAWLPREHGPAHTLMSEARSPTLQDNHFGLFQAHLANGAT